MRPSEEVLSSEARRTLGGRACPARAARMFDLTPPELSAMERVKISNKATYWPVAPIDLVIATPLVARPLLGATLPGRLLQAAALGAYLGTALQHWRARQGIRKIDFRREFGADERHLTPMPRETREAEIALLTRRLNDEYTPARI